MASQEYLAGTGFSIGKFIREESFGGFMLIVATIIALIWANSGFYGLYHHLLL